MIHLDRAGLGDWTRKLTACGLSIERVNTTMNPREATCPRCLPMTERNALLAAALSAACVRWGRAKAGLPAMEGAT